MDESFSLRCFVDQSLHEMALFDGSMRYLAASGVYRERLGLQPSFVGRSHYELFPDLAERWRQIHREVLAGAWHSGEHDEFPRQDGGAAWMDWEMGPWYRTDGRVGGAVLLASNAIQQMNVQRQLQRIEDQLRRIEDERQSLMMTATDGILVMDRRGSIVSSNPALQRMFGYGEGELRGQLVGLLLPETDRPRDGDYLVHLGLPRDPAGPRRPRVFRGRRKDGTEFPFRLALAEIDHLDVYVGYVEDQTEYTALREEIVSVANLEQQRIGRELHDATQQELTGLSLLANALAERLDVRAAPSEESAIAHQLCEGLAATQRSVQDLARGLLPVPVDSQGLPAALTALACSAARGSRVKLTTEVTGELPRFSKEAATHLYRIAQEAINNALRHAHPDHVALRLTSTAQGCELQIEDDGVGYDPARSSPKGVGLRLMEHRCSLAGGTLQLSRPPLGGTRVTCLIPSSAGVPS